MTPVRRRLDEPAYRRANQASGPNGSRELSRDALDRDAAELYARWFQALADPTRIVILSYLARQGDPVPVGVIVQDLCVGQSTVSHHLRTLHEVGFVTRARRGTNRLYAVNRNCVTKFPAAAEVIIGGGRTEDTQPTC
jgi:DNA-binding transcriptional ArsR family regulator